MKGAVIAVIAVCIVAAAGVGIAIGIQSQNASHTYSITYDLDGGTATDLPTSYNSGTITEIDCPTKKYIDSEGKEQDYYFLGWFTEKEYRNNIMYISKDMKGDVKLYAKWGENVVGSGFLYEYERQTEQTTWQGTYSRTTDGTYQYTYLHYDSEKGYYLNKILTINTESGAPIVSNTSNWSEEDEVEPTSTEENYKLELGERTVDTTKIVLEYSGVTEIQYLVYGWVPVKIDASYSTYYSDVESTYILDELYSNEVKDNYTVSVYTENGITVTGDGEHPRAETVVLTATAAPGFEFEGWYDGEGNLLGSKNTYTVDLLLSDIVIYARNTSVECDIEIDAGTSYTFTEGALNNVSWVISDSGNAVVATAEGGSFTYTFSDIGSYTVTSSGQDSNNKTVNKITTVLADGYCPKTYSWKYSGSSYSYTLNILYSDYYRYLSDPDVTRQQTSDDASMRELITCSDKYVVEIAEYIKEQTKSMSETDRANVLLKFTQYIEYKYDTESKGEEEYWKYPLETLFEQNGDCEDTSILFCAIGNAMGYDTALMLFSGHATGGINIEDLGYENKNIYVESQGTFIFKSYSYYIEENSKKVNVYYEGEHTLGTTSDRYYFYCETTSTDFVVKEIPNSNYDRSHVLNVIPATA